MMKTAAQKLPKQIIIVWEPFEIGVYIFKEESSISLKLCWSATSIRNCGNSLPLFVQAYLWFHGDYFIRASGNEASLLGTRMNLETGIWKPEER